MNTVNNNQNSITLNIIDPFIFFLKSDIYLFTQINNAPKRPPAIPKNIGPCTVLIKDT